MDEIPDYEPLWRQAVAMSWKARERQAAEQEARGMIDAGTRGAVTGGKHLGPLEEVVTRVLIDAGVRARDIHTGNSATLPGYFRELKDWDIVVMMQGRVAAVIEMKSQSGSFGNNLNNRIEEAIGQTVDFWKAVEVDLIPGLRPWFAYVMLVEASKESSSPVRTRSSIKQPDPAFKGKSYIERYAMTFERLHQERLLDAVTYAVAPKGSDRVTYPSAALSFQHFAVALHNRIREVRTVL